MKRRLWRLAGAVAVIASLSACTSGPTAEPTASSPAPAAEPTASSPAPATTSSSFGEPTVIADDLDAPWSIAFHGEVPLISERDSARILELDAEGNPRTVGTIEGVGGTGEGGLLGIAANNGYLYAYSTGDGENRIQRFEITGEAGSLGMGTPRTILDGIPAASFHNGGRIVFGPDGMLYATTGDAGNGGNAQDLDSLAGKILRMTPEGEVPEGNPFPDSLVYSYGHRNPQGIAWSEDGTMYATEFGQNTWDELNVIEAGGNYGWPEVEGTGGQDEYIGPVQQWEPAEASPSGMTITDGSIYIANLRGERLREVPLSALESSSEHFVGEYGRLRDVTVAPDGALWVLTNNTDGRGEPGPDDDRILRFDPAD